LSIGADGKIQGIKVMKSMGLGQDEMTLEAVKQWKFLPAYEDGVAVPSTATVQVEFRLM
jgi:TonB family protein